MPIFDQGYQHWQGPLSGHIWRWLTIARQGVRVQRQNRTLRLLLILGWLPALALVAAMVLWGFVERKSETVLALVGSMLPLEVRQNPQTFRGPVWTLIFSFFFKAEIFVIMLLVAVAGPGLISKDLRFNALPLYLARPLTRLDYFLGKLGVIGALVASVAVGPALFAYMVGMFFCLDLSVIKDTYWVLLGSLAYGLVVTLSAGTLILALSSLTRRSLYVGIIWAGLWLISSAVAGILGEIHHESLLMQDRATIINTWIDEHPPPPGIQLRDDPGGKVPISNARPEHREEGTRWLASYQQQSRRAWANARSIEGVSSRDDWRPLCSYVANLERCADLLLDTDSAWVSLGKAIGNPKGPLKKSLKAAGGGGAARQPPSYERRFADQMVLQYPWWWSAAVLMGLLGLSTWILNRQVKSLDRLR